MGKEKTRLLTGFHHIAIIASDYARSRAFYHNILQLPIISECWRAERKSWKLNLALPDGGQIELFSFPSSPPRLTQPEACGLRHVAFTVTHLEAMYTKLTMHGISTEPIRYDELTEKPFFFAYDPDHLPLEFYEA